MIAMIALELTWVDQRMKRLGSLWIVALGLGSVLSLATASAQSAAKKRTHRTGSKTTETSRHSARKQGAGSSRKISEHGTVAGERRASHHGGIRPKGQETASRKRSVHEHATMRKVHLPQ